MVQWCIGEFVNAKSSFESPPLLPRNSEPQNPKCVLRCKTIVCVDQDVFPLCESLRLCQILTNSLLGQSQVDIERNVRIFVEDTLLILILFWSLEFQQVSKEVFGAS